MQGDTTERGDTVVEPTSLLMAKGLRVYDASGEKIGTVRRYDLEAGYMVVEEGRLTKRELYIPFHLIVTIDPREMYLTVLKGELTDAYLLPPAATPLVEEQLDPETGQAEEVITHEIQSGSDGHPVKIEPVRLDEMESSLAVGMTVLDVDGGYVGEVTQIHEERRLLTVRNTVAGDDVRTIPFSVVAHVDPELEVVTLLVPSVALAAERRG